MNKTVSTRLKGAVASAIQPLHSDLRSQLFPPFQNGLLNNIRACEGGAEMGMQLIV
jgi:hypothetical protein